MKTIQPSIKNLPSIVAATLEEVEVATNFDGARRSGSEASHDGQCAFPFIRSTFYRWAQLRPIVCPELARGPQVLAVGDLHLDNFGTWRDLEGRLVWGVNDFDEAWPARSGWIWASGEKRLVAPGARLLPH